MRRIAVIIGAGPGLGATLAQTLSKTHSLLILARSLPGSLSSLKLNVPEENLIAASCDGSPAALESAFKQVSEKWPDGVVDVGIYNVGGKYSPGSFLDTKVEDLQENLFAFTYVN